VLSGKLTKLWRREMTLIMVEMFELSLEEQERASVRQGISHHFSE
jgi:hypothetical protein